MPAAVWKHLLGQDLPAHWPQDLAAPWWERSTPLASDCDVAIEKLGCTPAEYYRRTTPQERLLIRLYLAYRGEQQRMQDRLRQQRSEAQGAAQRQVRIQR